MIYNFLSRYGQFFALGLGALITIIFFAVVGVNGGTFEALEAEGLTRTQYNQKLSATSIFDFGLYGTAFLIILCTLALIGFGVWSIVKNPKASMKSLIGIGIVILIFVIAYFVAQSSGDPAGVQEVIAKINASTYAEDGSATLNTVTEAKSSFVSGGLSTMFVFILGSFLALLGFEAWNLFR